jgi:hypothetical protein
MIGQTFTLHVVLDNHHLTLAGIRGEHSSGLERSGENHSHGSKTRAYIGDGHTGLETKDV